MLHATDETIAAIATPIGEGAISIIRVSGQNAITNVDKIFTGKKKLIHVASHTAHFGKIHDRADNVIDEVVCIVYKAPNSYTGEDLVEICCHGGMHNTRKVLEAVLATEIRPAKPGEFTLRSFINGKMDLSQAEAVADLIKTQSDKGHKISLQQLEGSLSAKLASLREHLIKTTSLLELELDFAEDDIELINKENVRKYINTGIEEIEKLINSFFYGKVWKDGVIIALVGIPNAGKSSLMNAILKEERAIVTDIPGTTRDFIEESYIHDGVLYRLIDTAGLRETDNPIEKEGIRRTWEIIKKSNVVVLVHDSTKEWGQEEKELLSKIREAVENSVEIIIANNKSDLRHKELKDVSVKAVNTSAKDLTGVENLVSQIKNSVFKTEGSALDESVTITNQRHFDALQKAKIQLNSALDSLSQNKSEEFIALDLRGAIDSLGEIVGIVTTEDILNEIFSKFCIGK